MSGKLTDGEDDGNVAHEFDDVVTIGQCNHDSIVCLPGADLPAGVHVVLGSCKLIIVVIRIIFSTPCEQPRVGLRQLLLNRFKVGVVIHGPVDVALDLLSSNEKRLMMPSCDRWDSEGRFASPSKAYGTEMG